MDHHADITAQPPAYDIVADFLEGLVPGRCARAVRFRHELMSFAAAPTARSLFLTSVGQEGIEMARLVALLRTAVILRPGAASQRLEAARVAAGGLSDARVLIGAYASLDASAMRGTAALRALVGDDGDRELPQAGVFERAMLLKGRRTEIGGLTGGFVHIAEPADLPEPAQAALASLHGGVPFERVGASEEGEDLLAFDGVLICTTNRDRAADGLRADLQGRLIDREVAVPRLSEMMSDFGAYVNLAVARVGAEFDRFYGRTELSPEVARDFWRNRRPPSVLSTSVRTTLAAVDWSRHGEAAGLLGAVRAIIGGQSVADVVAGLTRPVPRRPPSVEDTLIAGIEKVRDHDGKGLSGLIRVVELRARSALKARLRTDAAALHRLALQMGIETSELTAQAAQIDRDRSTSGGKDRG